MASKEYCFSLLDPLSTRSLLEEISSLLCRFNPEFGPLFGEDHRRRVEEDVRKEKMEVREVGSKKVEEEVKVEVEVESRESGKKYSYFALSWVS